MISLFFCIASCNTSDDEDVYCWECVSKEGGRSWTEELHDWTDSEISDLIKKDLSESIETKCYKIKCDDH